MAGQYSMWGTRVLDPTLAVLAGAGAGGGGKYVATVTYHARTDEELVALDQPTEL